MGAKFIADHITDESFERRVRLYLSDRAVQVMGDANASAEDKAFAGKILSGYSLIDRDSIKFALLAQLVALDNPFDPPDEQLQSLVVSHFNTFAVANALV